VLGWLVSTCSCLWAFYSGFMGLFIFFLFVWGINLILFSFFFQRMFRFPVFIHPFGFYGAWVSVTSFSFFLCYWE